MNNICIIIFLRIHHLSNLIFEDVTIYVNNTFECQTVDKHHIEGNSESFFKGAFSPDDLLLVA